MINKSILTFFFLIIVFCGCNAQNSNSTNVKDALIKQLINHSKIKSSLTHGKIFILETQFCNRFNCDTYFQDYKKQIQVYSKAELFMRGIRVWVEIVNIDKKNGQMSLFLKTKNGSEEIKLKL